MREKQSPEAGSIIRPAQIVTRLERIYRHHNFIKLLQRSYNKDKQFLGANWLVGRWLVAVERQVVSGFKC